MDADEYRSRKAAYMRERRAKGGDVLREHENAARREYRRTPEGMEVRRREYRNQYAKERGLSGESARFVGVDGEGGDVNGRHEYLLLRAGDHVLETGQPLTWEDCFSFLADLDPTVIYVAYFFDYDVTMMCSGMPEYKIRRLLNREERFGKSGKFATPFPLDIGPYEIDYIHGKFFKVRRATPTGTRNKPWVEISDVGRFFQQSFVRTLIDWGVSTPEELDSIGTGKEQRSDFGAMTDDIRRYNRLEIDCLERLMNKFRATCQTIGHQPRKWQGPGDLASSLLQYHKIPKRTELPYWDDVEFRKFADSSYYGGRFETSAVGNLPGPIYAADINSAYPYALTKVPCLVHGRWEHTRGRPQGLYLASGSFEAKWPASFYGLPVRNRNGGVSFPADNGVGTYWSFEIEAAKHQIFDIADSWSYVPGCECTPFDWIHDLYWRRLQLKKDTQGKILKLGMNSLYGKMAQRIGSAPYNNYVWGSFITAHCRTQLQRFIHSLPSCSEGYCGINVSMLATDGIFTSELPEGFESSEHLGGWDLKTYPQGIFIVQPGLYFDNGGTQDVGRLAKTRGVPTNKALEYEGELRQAFKEIWHSQNPTATSVAIPMSSFVGLRLGMHRRDRSSVGQWMESDRHIGFDWRSKREYDTRQEDGYLRTYPPQGSLLDVSRAYDVELAAELDGKRVALMDTDGPDWAPIIASSTELL